LSGDKLGDTERSRTDRSQFKLDPVAGKNSFVDAQRHRHLRSSKISVAESEGFCRVRNSERDDRNERHYKREYLIFALHPWLDPIAYCLLPVAFI
jgi:hypothetical protein